ncbi:hypothetical protein VNI00_018887 [Paramarasmius palmivorus]|uniref:Uncharacterized protein n=1 Tax=Paramarasmius palmivorus TaxID=297713 RepID=A0AAW0ATV4_9AGAR
MQSSYQQNYVEGHQHADFNYDNWMADVYSVTPNHVTLPYYLNDIINGEDQYPNPYQLANTPNWFYVDRPEGSFSNTTTPVPTNSAHGVPSTSPGQLQQSPTVPGLRLEPAKKPIVASERFLAASQRRRRSGKKLFTCTGFSSCEATFTARHNLRSKAFVDLFGIQLLRYNQIISGLIWEKGHTNAPSVPRGRSLDQI